MTRCQDCGAPFVSEVMPEACPSCFERRIAPIFNRAGTLGELLGELIEAGCHPQRIEAQRQGLAREAFLG